MKKVCSTNQLVANSGVCVQLPGADGYSQVALFYLPDEARSVFAVSNWDPIGNANVISRGIIGSSGDRKVVASPLYKQRFDLETGQCIEDDQYSLRVYQTKISDDDVFVGA